MPVRHGVFAPGNYYHLYNRGVSRQNIFFSDENFLFCTRLIEKYARAHLIAVIAYCLMPNHYHLLVRQDGQAAVSRFISVVFNTYVQAVNRQLGRSGTLFQGRFLHVQVEREEYLVHLCRYIHLNPVVAGLVRNPEDWAFSNYLECVGNGRAPCRTGPLSLTTSRVRRTMSGL
ncbi:MAG: transposase [bacterium]|jgi:REP element-mobilizing transposase RayT|nr:transposase [candidate division KSB1 bacterium]MDH7559970.1 transposase [bacterium]